MTASEFNMLELKAGDKIQVTYLDGLSSIETLYSESALTAIPETSIYNSNEKKEAIPERIAVIAGIELGGTKPIFLHSVSTILKV